MPLSAAAAEGVVIPNAVKGGIKQQAQRQDTTSGGAVG